MANDQTINTGDLTESVEYIHWLVGAWGDLGYAEPVPPGGKPMPPLGERSADAIRSGHAAVAEIDKLTRRLYEVRTQLITEMRQDSDIRAKRVDAMIAERAAQRESN